MPYVHVVTVGLKEVGRTLSPQDAAKLMVEECQKLIDGGAGPSVRGGCWIEGYLVTDQTVAKDALSPDYNLTRHRWVGVDQFNDVITNAHTKGWMSGGEWVAQAA